MSMEKEEELEPRPHPVAVEHRAKVRTGFGLCCVGLTLAVVASLSPILVAPLGVNWVKAHEEQVQYVFMALGFIVEAVLIAGWLSLYLVPHGLRWRRAGMCLLAMAGADLVALAMPLVTADKAQLAWAELVGAALGWVQMWMLAILAAEAAESAERSDITYQTEVAGRLIVWGGFTWLGERIWSFDPKSWPLVDPEAIADSLGFAYVLALVALVLYLFVLIRTTIICGGLAMSYASTHKSSHPESPV